MVETARIFLEDHNAKIASERLREFFQVRIPTFLMAYAAPLLMASTKVVKCVVCSR